MIRQGSTCPKGTGNRSQSWEQKDSSKAARSRRGIELDGQDKAQETGTIRVSLVARVKKEIADGTYDTPEKLEAALDRLIGRLDLD